MRRIQGPGENRRLFPIKNFITLRFIVVEVVVLLSEWIRFFIESLSNEEPMEDRGRSPTRAICIKSCHVIMRWIQEPSENRQLFDVQIFIILRFIVAEVVVLRREWVEVFIESLSN